MQYDLIIRNGTVIDGTGAPPRRADLAVDGGRIAEIGDLSRVRAVRTIDATGLAAAPGFIDAHTHDDRALLESDMEAKASQGVTTVVAGNCGISLAPFTPDREAVPPMSLIKGNNGSWFPTFAAYMQALDDRPPTINGLFLVGHSTLRIRYLDDLGRPATADEIGRMREDVGEAMRAGAAGLSTGLYYPPARAAPTDEVVALAETAARFGGVYATHLRDEGDHLEESVGEAIEIGERADLAVVLSHHKAVGPANHGKVARSLSLIGEAAARRPVGFDAYPYAASATALLLDRLAHSSKVLITWSETLPEAAGRDLAEIAAEHGLSQIEMAERLQPAGAIYFAMDEDDVRMVLQSPLAMIGSDGNPHDRHPHPRLWGTFPRVLGLYSRELGLMPLEEAVRRMTGLPAQRFGLRDRGTLKSGNVADLCVFNPGTVIDRATFDNPLRPAEGIVHVLVAGVPVHSNGSITGNRPGRALRRGNTGAQ